MGQETSNGSRTAEKAAVVNTNNSLPVESYQANAQRQKEIAQILATNGTRGKSGGRGHIPLSKEMSLKSKAEIGHYLKSCGIQITANDNGETEAVLCACQNGHKETLIQLKAFGVDIHAADHEGVTSLMIASLNGHIDIVEYLILNGADVNAISSEGANSIHCASQNGHVQVVKKLVDCGAHVASQTVNGFTALHFAALNGEVAVVDYFLIDPRCNNSKTGLNVNTSDADGVTPLMCACFCGNVDIVNKLLQAGANPSMANQDGLTALLYAVAGGHLEIVKLLTVPSQNSSDVTIEHSEQAKSIAESMGHHHIVEYLRK